MKEGYRDGDVILYPTQVFSVDNWALKHNQPEKPPFIEHILAIGSAAKPVVFKAPKLSSNAERVSQGTKPGAQPGHKKHSTSLKQPYVSSKEATKGGSSKAPTGSKTSHLKNNKDSSSTMESNPSQTSEVEASSTIKLEDLAKRVQNVQPSFKDLDSPKDDPIIVVDDSDEDEEANKDGLHATSNIETKDVTVPKSYLPGQLNELLVKSLQTKFSKILSTHDLSSSLPTELNDLPYKFNELTKEVKRYLYGLLYVVFKHKFHADGTLSHYKARLVANNSSRQLGVDFNESFSLVLKPATIRMVLSLVMSRKCLIHQLDVKNAFLNGDLSETVYIHQPPGFVDASLFYSQRKYVLQLLERAHMVNCNPSRISVDTESKLVQQIFLYMHDLLEPHLAALKRILRYVEGSLDLGLYLYASSATSLVGYTDADWASCPSTCRSALGYCVFFGDNLLSWSAKRHHTLLRSIFEAEYQVVANVVLEIAWLCNLLSELHSSLSTATLKVVLLGNGVEAIKNMVKDESYLIPYLIGNRLYALEILTKVFVVDRNRGRVGFVSMISGRGGGWFTIRWWIGGSRCGGVVIGGGVVLGVVSSSVEEMLFGDKSVVGGDSRSIDGGATL
nr:ribonuclease H-like domain-containing protein [Tanacetum cinerariifolium]